VLALFGACELLGDAYVVGGSYSVSPLKSVFSLVVIFTAAHVTAGAGGVGTIKSVAEHAVAASSRYTASGLASSRVVSIAPPASVAAGGESYSTTTCGKLWAIHVLPSDAFSAASTMSADAEAALGGAEALGLVAMPVAMSSISGVPLCHVCHVCVMFFSAGG
jgi:hypothetical protein